VWPSARIGISAVEFAFCDIVPPDGASLKRKQCYLTTRASRLCAVFFSPTRARLWTIPPTAVGGFFRSFLHPTPTTV